MKKPLIPFALRPSSWGLKGKERELAELRYNLGDTAEFRQQAGDIEAAHQKAEASAAGEPYVNVLRMGIDGENIVQGYFELDWNDEFVKMLQENGISGKNDEEVVNKWFNAVCKTVLIQEQADYDYGMQPQKNGRADVIRKSEFK
jgi:hypothetical protein